MCGSCRYRYSGVVWDLAPLAVAGCGLVAVAGSCLAAWGNEGLATNNDILKELDSDFDKVSRAIKASTQELKNFMAKQTVQILASVQDLKIQMIRDRLNEIQEDMMTLDIYGRMREAPYGAFQWHRLREVHQEAYGDVREEIGRAHV